MKTYIKNPETETKLFLCPSTSSDTDGCAADTSVRIYAHGGFFSELGINGNLGWGTVGECFFCFCQKKNKNGNLGWGTLGDAEVNHNYQASECYCFHITGIRPKRVKKIMTNGVPARW